LFLRFDVCALPARVAVRGGGVGGAASLADI